MATSSAARIRTKCAEMARFLIRKNESYGDSALHPVGIFGQGDAEALIRARLDDKLSRIRNAPDAFGEDAIMDMCGYLILLMLAREDKAARPEAREGRVARGLCGRAYRREAMPGAAQRGNARRGRSSPGLLKTRQPFTCGGTRP